MKSTKAAAEVVAVHGRPAPEAYAAASGACYRMTADVAAAVTGSASGVELARDGFAEDVAIAAEPDATTTVPVLIDEAFTAAGPAGP